MNKVKMSPLFFTEAEFEAGYKQSVFYVEKDFQQEYEKHLAALDHIANIAKSYIFNNWKKIEDWSDLDLTIHSRGVETHYYKFIDRGLPYTSKSKISERTKTLLAELAKKDKKNENPITVFNEVVLDPTDGDFSVTINGTEHWWIDNKAVITIANFIEQKLKTKVS